jgi:hypothetical protein
MFEGRIFFAAAFCRERAGCARKRSVEKFSKDLHLKRLNFCEEYENITNMARPMKNRRETGGKPVGGEVLMAHGVERFLDEEGRVKLWPAKRAPKEEVLAYLAEKFEFDRDYTEHEVNAKLSVWHTFEDFFILRRELIESGWLMRTSNGSRYWKNPERREDNP